MTGTLMHRVPDAWLSDALKAARTGALASTGDATITEVSSTSEKVAVSVEVMEPRTTSVVYKDTILKSVEKTSRLVIEDEIYGVVSRQAVTWGRPASRRRWLTRRRPYAGRVLPRGEPATWPSIELPCTSGSISCAADALFPP